MGILNATPDSFSDGGRFALLDSAIAQIEKMVAEGADIIDIGGESTRPGAQAVSVEEELDRVIPLVEAACDISDIIVSVDTSKAEVMREAVAAGADLINDVKALTAEGALEVAAELGVPVCLMHMQGEPRTMQSNPDYQDVVAEVKTFLNDRILACEEAGISREDIIIDPGFGFGKTLPHNLALFNNLPALFDLDCPLLLGVSRKSMLGQITGREVGEREIASVAAAVAGAMLGAQIFRVHDVAATVDALKVAHAIKIGEAYCD